MWLEIGFVVPFAIFHYTIDYFLRFACFDYIHLAIQRLSGDLSSHGDFSSDNLVNSLCLCCINTRNDRHLLYDASIGLGSGSSGDTLSCGGFVLMPMYL